MKRGDKFLLILSAILCAILGAALLLMRFGLFDGEEIIAEISSDGKVIETIPLSAAPREILVESPKGVNVFRIGGGSASVVSADCRDHLCVREGSVSHVGEGVVCLPHKAVLRIKGGGASDLWVTW